MCKHRASLYVPQWKNGAGTIYYSYAGERVSLDVRESGQRRSSIGVLITFSISRKAIKRSSCGAGRVSAQPYWSQRLTWFMSIAFGLISIIIQFLVFPFPNKTVAAWLANWIRATAASTLVQVYERLTFFVIIALQRKSWEKIPDFFEQYSAPDLTT